MKMLFANKQKSTKAISEVWWIQRAPIQMQARCLWLKLLWKISKLLFLFCRGRNQTHHSPKPNHHIVPLWFLKHTLSTETYPKTYPLCRRLRLLPVLRTFTKSHIGYGYVSKSSSFRMQKPPTPGVPCVPLPSETYPDGDTNGDTLRLANEPYRCENLRVRQARKVVRTLLSRTISPE